MNPVLAENHFPWYIDSSDTDNIDCQCGAACNGLAGWARHITNQLQGASMKNVETVIYSFARFKKTWGSSYLADDLATKLTCDEAESLAAMLNLIGDDSSAQMWLEKHSYGDDCDDQHCRCADCSCSGHTTVRAH